MRGIEDLGESAAEQSRQYRSRYLYRKDRQPKLGTRRPHEIRALGGWCQNYGTTFMSHRWHAFDNPIAERIGRVEARDLFVHNRKGEGESAYRAGSVCRGASGADQFCRQEQR
ncbi:Uncharacterised protein [Mycobacteroides abscessus subsp. abscessus]|nr:Uncharacterised protein [Mycobacteroides abscessus subsp. abscessus]